MGIISSNTIQVGRQLVKTFGEGQNFKKVVTETLEDGNILTRVFNNEGKQLTERLKKIGNMEEVGDKLVKTTTKVIKDEEGVITKQVRDRVYDPALVKAQLDNMQKRNDLMKVVAEQYAAKGKKTTESELLSTRISPALDYTNEYHHLRNLNKKIASNITVLGERIEKYSSGGNRLSKILSIFGKNDGIISRMVPVSRTFTDILDGLRNMRYYMFGNNTTYYNRIGLPNPSSGIFTINGKALDYMSLKDMRRLFQKYHPGEKYSGIPSLARLDEPVEGDKITKLGKFL